MTTDPKALSELIAEAIAKFNALSPEEQKAQIAAQRDSWVRAEMSWPAPKFKWVDGVKVYASYEDYIND